MRNFQTAARSVRGGRLKFVFFFMEAEPPGDEKWSGVYKRKEKEIMFSYYHSYPLSLSVWHTGIPTQINK